MTDLWEPTFAQHRTMWGQDPTASAVRASQLFMEHQAESVLIPGVGYGRNAGPFLDAGMSVVGIEIAETAIALARSDLGLDFPIHHGSVTDMPFDDFVYDGVFCFGLIYLLDGPGRAKLIRDCYRQLAPGGWMIFTVVSKHAPMYGQGVKLGDDWFETHCGMRLYFYDAVSLERAFAPHGLVEVVEIDEAAAGGGLLPFHFVACRRPL